MDSDKEYVEVFDDEGGARDKRDRPAQLRRYKVDAYRSATRMHARTHVPALCPLPLIYPALLRRGFKVGPILNPWRSKTRPALASCIMFF